MRTHMLGAKRPTNGWCRSFAATTKPSKPSAHRAAPVTKRKATPIVVYFPTWKGGLRMERLRHYFHEDMALLLEADPDVIRWSAESESEDLEHDDGELHAFRPAFRAETRDGLRLIKLQDDSREHLGLTTKGPQPLKTGGVTYEYYTRTALARHPRLETSSDILFHRPRCWAPELPLRIAAMAMLEHPTTLGELHQCLGQCNVPFEDLVSLVAQGFIEVDLDYKVGPEMPVLACHGKGLLG